MLLHSRFFQQENSKIKVIDVNQASPMANSMGVGIPLVSKGNFGADLIHFAAGEGVQNHTHAGDHILFGLSGTGYVIYEGIPHKIEPGFCYFVEGQKDHAIKAETALTLIAVGNQHFPVDSPKRMEKVPYRDSTRAEFKI